MQIGQPSAMQYQNIQHPPTTTLSQQQAVSNSNGDSVTISESAQQLKSLEKDIVGQYNVRNMSPNQMNEMATKLRDNSLISDKERLNMTFELRMDKQIGAEYNGDQPIDFLQQFQGRYEFSKQNGGSPAHNNMLKGMIDLLKRYEQM